MRRGRALLVALLLVVSCSSGDDKDSLSEGDLRDRVDAVLAIINDGTGADDLDSLFSASALNAISASELTRVLREEMASFGPFEIGEVVSSSKNETELVIESDDGVRMTMRVHIDDSADHLIDALQFLPAKARSWDDLDALLRAAAPEVAFVAAEVDGNDCTTVHGLDPDKPLALGSAFKLYVLGALAHEIEAGRASWDEGMILRPELRVHTSPTYANVPDGREATLQELARAMITLSDNTATDHVMARVGRPAIEASLAPLGMTDPSLDLPFPTTREASLLKWKAPAEQRAAYIDADETARRQILESLTGPAREPDVLFVPTPVDVDTIEWFATANDLCRVHARLQEMAKRSALEPIRSIVASAPPPGSPIDSKVFPYLAAKGGSEPGVLTQSWLVEREDGKTFAVAALFRSTTEALPSDLLTAIAANAFPLLADED